LQQDIVKRVGAIQSTDNSNPEEQRLRNRISNTFQNLQKLVRLKETSLWAQAQARELAAVDPHPLGTWRYDYDAKGELIVVPGAAVSGGQFTAGQGMNPMQGGQGMNPMQGGQGMNPMQGGPNQGPAQQQPGQGQWGQQQGGYPGQQPMQQQWGQQQGGYNPQGGQLGGAYGGRQQFPGQQGGYNNQYPGQFGGGGGY